MVTAINDGYRTRVSAMTRDTDTSWHRSGCGPRCRAFFAKIAGAAYPDRIIQHDPDHHEAYGLNVLAYDRPTLLNGVINAGALMVDGITCTATVSGKFVSLTPREFSMLAMLASRVDTCVSQDDMLRTIWGPEYVTELGYKTLTHGNSNVHLIRVNLSRLRTKLGTARALIETVSGIGYVLHSKMPERGAR